VVVDREAPIVAVPEMAGGAMFAGARVDGGVPALTYAESEQLAHLTPGDQFAGRLDRPVCIAVCEHVELPGRSTKLSVPPVPSRAIQ
jgi:hypothetical protein